MLLSASNLPTADLLTDFVWIFAVGTVVTAFLHTKKLPSLLGFLVTGVVLGPAGLGLVQDRAAIEILAEIGIVLLMFTIGLEVSLADLAKLARRVIGGGLLQIGVTTALVAGLGMWFGLAPIVAVTVGLIVSASSTALVLRLLGDRGELRKPYGQFSMAILLAQDFAVVVLMLLLPMLAVGELGAGAILFALLEAAAISGGIVIIARFAFPWVLKRVVELRSREVFLMCSVAAIFGTAWVADALGLSLALGAFLAGLVISESEYSHQMSAEVLPFRDVLNGLFFVSVGLLVERSVLVDNLGLLLGLMFASLVFKATVVLVAAKLFKLDNRSALLAAVALAQVGEFALVLAQQAALLKLITHEQHSLLIGVAVLTMMLTPLALPLAHRLLAQTEQPSDSPETTEHDLNDHVIVVGYGLNGQNVAGALKQLSVPFLVVETNRNTVMTERARGVPIVFGDATRPALLHHLRVDRARALVACIANAPATREIVNNARHANPDLLIIARTRFVAEVEPLQELGADHVVPEEFETSMELIGRVMRAYGASEAAIHREKRALRANQYRALVDEFPTELEDLAHYLTDVDVEGVRIVNGGGQTLASLDLRNATGATAVAVIRDGETHAAPAPSFVLEDDDVALLVGTAAAVDAARALLS